MLGRLFKLAFVGIVVGAIVVACFLWRLHSAPVREGVLATVNGSPISLHDVQVRVDSRRNIDATSSFEDMRDAYVEILRSMIVVRLMERELAERGLLPTDEQMREWGEAWLRDYTPEQGEELFGELVITRAEWLDAMRDYRIAQLFEKHVLGQNMLVPLEAIRAVYEQHGDAFTAPDTFSLCGIQATDKGLVESFCATLGKEGARAATADTFPAPACARLKREELPDAALALAKKGKTLVCTRAEQQDGVWQAMWLAGSSKGERLPIQDVYGLIESMLREQGKQDALGAWLEQAVARADIRLAPEMAPDVLNLQKAEKRLSKPVTNAPETKSAK